jgi:hypothetical protein
MMNRREARQRPGRIHIALYRPRHDNKERSPDHKQARMGQRSKELDVVKVSMPPRRRVRSGLNEPVRTAKRPMTGLSHARSSEAG